MIERPTIGQPAPDIDLLSNRREQWRLSQHRGRSVVVIFHRHDH